MSVRDDILRTLSTLGPSSMAEIHEATGQHGSGRTSGRGARGAR